MPRSPAGHMGRHGQLKLCLPRALMVVSIVQSQLARMKLRSVSPYGALRLGTSSSSRTTSWLVGCTLFNSSDGIRPGGRRPKRSVGDKTKREERPICGIRCALRIPVDCIQPAASIPASPAYYQEDRQAQQCLGSVKWDGGRLSPMP